MAHQVASSKLPLAPDVAFNNRLVAAAGSPRISARFNVVPARSCLEHNMHEPTRPFGRTWQEDRHPAQTRYRAAFRRETGVETRIKLRSRCKSYLPPVIVALLRGSNRSLPVRLDTRPASSGPPCVTSFAYRNRSPKRAPQRAFRFITIEWLPARGGPCSELAAKSDSRVFNRSPGRAASGDPPGDVGGAKAVQWTATAVSRPVESGAGRCYERASEDSKEPDRIGVVRSGLIADKSPRSRVNAPARHVA